MSRNLMILTLLIGILLACNPVQPPAIVSETPHVPVAMPDIQPIATDAAAPAPPTVTPAVFSDLKLTILYDNTTVDEALQSDWGFAALVEYGDHTLLFDTGAGNGAILQDNMRQLGIDPQSIEAVVLSHQHNDHIRGLQALLDMGVQPIVYIPAQFSKTFKRTIGEQTTVVEVDGPLETIPGIYATGLASTYVEQALLVETQDGTVLLVGCAHPGVVKLVNKAQEIVPGKVVMLAGGFHLVGDSDETVQPLITELRQLDVEGVMPAHCTGDPATALFQTEYGENFNEAGVGRILTFSAAE